MSTSRIGEQLNLFDCTVGNLRGRLDPWEGRSPRELTTAYKRFTLKTQGEKKLSGPKDSEQYDLWLPIQKAPWKYQGAPLLLDRRPENIYG